MLVCVPRSNLIALAAALAIFVVGAAHADVPKRVVSMNLCTDQLAMMLAAPGQLVSVSRIAADPLSSAMSDEAQDYPLNNGRAEEIYALDPDLVLAGNYSDPLAISMLRNLGIKVMQFDIADELADIPAQVRLMGQALGRTGESEKLADEFETAIKALKAPDTDRPTAAFFYANGYSLGAGTLSNDIITHVGFTNLAERIGRAGGGRLSLEELLLHRPDVLITAPRYAGASLSEAVMAHPALADIPRVDSSSAWICGTPLVLGAVSDMVRARQQITASQ